jgi:hypothetical protein
MTGLIVLIPFLCCSGDGEEQTSEKLKNLGKSPAGRAQSISLTGYQLASEFW